VDFAMSEEERGAITAIRLSGELDMATAPSLLARIDELLSLGRHRILLDLADLTFCDSAGLNGFIRADRRCVALGGWLRLTGHQGHVARVIQLSGLDEVLRYHGSTEIVPP
jgi:anti-sigma B factor antagonist